MIKTDFVYSQYRLISFTRHGIVYDWRSGLKLLFHIESYTKVDKNMTVGEVFRNLPWQ